MFGEATVRKLLMVFLTLLFLVILVSFTMTYSVRFTEAGVLTTFGKAGEGAVKHEPGLHFKWPYPVQSVTKYDTRVRVLTAKLETQQTKDNRQITIEGYCFWRVEDPLKFFQRFSNAGSRAEDHYTAAENVIKSNLRAAQGLVSEYRMNELFSEQAGASKMGELEGRVLARLSAKDEKTGLSLADYGITPASVGISKVVLPESVTTAVFEAMKTRRELLTRETESRGEAQATAIKSRAENDAKRIRAFAENRAQQIRALGDLESTQFLAAMNQNPELAVFLGQIKFMEQFSAKATTLVLPATMPGMGLFFPNVMDRLKAGQIPASRSPEEWLADPTSAKPVSVPGESR